MAETGATVPLEPPWLSRLGILSGRPVRGQHWKGLALAANHLLGRGAVLIPHAFCNTQLPKSATTTLRFKAWCSLHATHRLWALTIRVATATSPSPFVFTDASGGTHAFSVPAGTSGETFRVEFIETVATPSGSEEELVVTFEELDNVSDPDLAFISCTELPRPDLAIDTSEYGVSVDGHSPGRTVHLATGYGPGSVLASLDAAVGIAKRAGLFQFARGDSDYLTTTSTSSVPVFASGAVPILLDRSLFVGDTVRTVPVRVRASSGTATTGEIVFTMGSGDTLTLSITSAMSPTWLSGSIDVHAEDLSASDGRRASTNDDCVITWQRLSGASTLTIQSISIGGAST